MSSSVSAVNTLLSGTATTTPAVNISSILAASAGASTPGIDVASAVAAALYADRAPERGWQADQATLSSQTTALTAIQTATEAVVNDIQALNSLTGPLAARTVTSSNSSDLTATAAAGTVSGVHTVVINNVATTGSWYSDLESSPTAPLPTSSLTLTTASGDPVTIATGAGNTGDTLTDLATAINSATTSSGASLGVTATVVSDSTGSRLAIISNSPGAAADFSITSANYTGTSWTSPDIPPNATLGTNSVTLISGSATAVPPTLATLTIASTSGQTYAQFAATINAAVSAYNTTANTAIPPTPNLSVTATAGSNANGTNLTIASTDTTPFTIDEPAFGFTQANQATNASLTVDGIPISSATNIVSGAIPGVTLSVLGASLGSPISLTVAADASRVSTAINQLVTDYNTALGLVTRQFNVSTGTSKQGPLAADPTIRSLQNTLEQAVSFADSTASGTTVSTLANLGISVGNDGTLSVDTATLNGALTNNPTDVQNFFQGTARNGFANAMYIALNTFTSPGNGAFTVDLSSISSSNAALTAEISNFETNYIAVQQAMLTANLSSAEVALQQLPQQMALLNAELGFNSNGGK